MNRMFLIADINYIFFRISFIIKLVFDQSLLLMLIQNLSNQYSISILTNNKIKAIQLIKVEQFCVCYLYFIKNKYTRIKIYLYTYIRIFPN